MMTFMKHLCLLFASLVLILGCEAEDPELPPTNQLSAFAQNLLNAHNDWRAQVGVGKLEWDEELAQKAKDLLDAEACRIGDNEEELGQNGVYAFMGATGREVVRIWASVEPAYDYESDSCQLALDACNPYKQVVWATSKRLGCANVLCFDGTSNMWVCLYDPKGNVPGERPY